jgi:hypothetical protein
MTKIKAPIAIVTIVLFCAYAGASLAAESPCKGLDNAACAQNAVCSWVKSYKTKAGHDVKAFCRKKNGKAQAAG